MDGRPWGLSVWAGFLCVLLALSSVMHGSLRGGALLTAGALFLFGWALWLVRR
jgi:hypothetical protein